MDPSFYYLGWSFNTGTGLLLTHEQLPKRPKKDLYQFRENQLPRKLRENPSEMSRCESSAAEKKAAALAKAKTQAAKEARK